MEENKDLNRIKVMLAENNSSVIFIKVKQRLEGRRIKVL